MNVFISFIVLFSVAILQKHVTIFLLEVQKARIGQTLAVFQ